MNQDIPKETRRKLSKLFYLRRKLLANDKNLRLTVRKNLLFVNNVRFHWDESERLIWGKENGGAKLSEIVKKDVSGILELLKEDNPHAK